MKHIAQNGLPASTARRYCCACSGTSRLQEDRMDKTLPDLATAVAGIEDGMTVMN